MAVTLAIFAAVQVAVPLGVRPHLIPPVRTVSPLSASNITGRATAAPARPPGAGAGPKVDTSRRLGLLHPGHRPGRQHRPRPGPPGMHAPERESDNACNTALARLHLQQVVTYQPASRYWAFQWAETGLYLLLALLLTGFCTWRVNRRLTR